MIGALPSSSFDVSADEGLILAEVLAVVEVLPVRALGVGNLDVSDRKLESFEESMVSLGEKL